MEIDYTKVVRNYVEPKLAYHGFKYNEEESDPITGSYRFTRIYWGKPQYISISRVSYRIEDLAELVAEGDEVPSEVPQEFLKTKESDMRLWLSNRYLDFSINGAQVIRNVSLFQKFVDMESLGTGEESKGRLRKPYWWWEFHGETELRQVLHDIVEVVLNEGLDFLEEDVADTRRYHEKLDARRKAEKERRDQES